MVKILLANEKLLEQAQNWEIRDYHGVFLTGPEWEYMQALEQQLHAPIPAVATVKWNTFGFCAQANHVTALGLYRKGLTSLPTVSGT